MKKSKLKGLFEGEIEWILEAKAEGYTWKQLAAKYKVSIKTLKKFVTNGN